MSKTDHKCLLLNALSPRTFHKNKLVPTHEGEGCFERKVPQRAFGFVVFWCVREQ